MKRFKGYVGLFLAVFMIWFFSSCNVENNSQIARFYYYKYTGKDARFDKSINSDNQYFNPIISGFYPDPSICRKGDTYYLVNSSFSFFPGVPVFKSKDLVNWEQIGHVLDRPSQLHLTTQAISMGIFAPAIEYNPYNETFYMITTSAYGIGNFYVKTKDPEEGWSDPILLPDIDGIDPSFFFDEDGKGYIVHNAAPLGSPDWNQQRAIRIYEFDVDSDRVTGKFKEIIRGGSRPENKPIWIEGPHLYKINGYYYLMCAEGGTSTDHSEVIFRSKSPWGPYESYKNNPILTQRDLPDDRAEKVTCAGHADIVQTPEGDWWAVFLACRPYEGNLVNTGRETFLLPVQWIDEFPVILPKGEPIPTIIEKNNLVPGNNPTTGNFEYIQEFNNEPDFSWIFIRTPEKKFYNIEDGSLNIKPLPVSIEERKSPAVILRRQQHTNFEAETKLEFIPDSAKEFAGMVLFQNEKFQYLFGKTMKDDQVYLVLSRIEREKQTLSEKLLTEKETESPVFLKVEGKGRYYDFLYSFDGENWTILYENADGVNLSTSRAGGFIGTMIGLYASCVQEFN